MFVINERKIVPICLSRLCMMSVVLAASSLEMAGGGGGGGVGGAGGADSAVYSWV